MGRPLPSMKRFCRAASKPWAISGSPASIRLSFAVVPPMSKASNSVSPSRAPKNAAANAPAAGPDSSICTGLAVTSSIWVSPPLEIISSNGAVMPISAS